MAVNKYGDVVETTAIIIRIGILPMKDVTCRRSDCQATASSHALRDSLRDHIRHAGSRSGGLLLAKTAIGAYRFTFYLYLYRCIQGRQVNR